MANWIPNKNLPVPASERQEAPAKGSESDARGRGGAARSTTPHREVEEDSARPRRARRTQHNRRV